MASPLALGPEATRRIRDETALKAPATVGVSRSAMVLLPFKRTRRVRQYSSAVSSGRFLKMSLEVVRQERMNIIAS